MSHVHAIIFFFFCTDVILVLLYVLVFLFGKNPLGKAEPVLLDLGAEGSIPSWYSAMKLLLVGFCAYFYGRLIFQSDRIAGALILLCAAGFGYLSMDEGAALHEKLGSNIDKLVIGGKLAFGNPFPVTGLWMVYLAPPLCLALVGGVVYLRKRLSIPTGIFIKAIAGIVTFIAAAASDILLNFVTPLTKPLEVATEEFGEMVGVTLILWAVMTLLAQQDAAVVGGATVPASSSAPAARGKDVRRI
jgi:hypothetical protein